MNILYNRESNSFDPSALAFIVTRFSFCCLWKKKVEEMAKMSNKGVFCMDNRLSKSNKNVCFFLISAMATFFSIYGKWTYLFSLISDLDPPFILGNKSRFLKILGQFHILVKQRRTLDTFSVILRTKKVFFVRLFYSIKQIDVSFFMRLPCY